MPSADLEGAAFCGMVDDNRSGRGGRVAILSIQSHVVYGHVGNRAAVFPLERLGFEVWPINTVQLSNHRGYDTCSGESFTGAHIELVWSGVKRRGVLRDCEAVLSGYISNAAVGSAILSAVEDVKAANPAALYCCDPVIGDYGSGVYVEEEVVPFMADHALYSADIIAPNQFEAETLTGLVIDGVEDAKRAVMAIHERGPKIVLVTSFQPAGSGGNGEATGVFVSDGTACHMVMTPDLPFAEAPRGVGDLASALFLAHYLRTRDCAEAAELTVDAVYAVLERSLVEGRGELAIVAAQDAIAAPRRRFTAKRV
jgi:pyridoxine kinase